MYVSCYLRKGVVYLPTAGQVYRGYYRGIEPVAVVPVAATDELRRALRETIARGNPKVPDLPTDALPPPVLPKYAGVKNWAAFDRGASLWALSKRDGVYSIVGYRRRRDSGREPDPNQRVTLPPEASVEELTVVC